MSMRIGIVGSGFWAREVHAPGLASAPEVELVSVYARDLEAAATTASPYRAQAFTDFEAFLSTVDAVDFAVPPDVQATLAVEAAQAGKHLLLEKPIALDSSGAIAISDAVRRAHVASVVFFTARFQPEIERWLLGVAAERWSSGTARWCTPAMTDPDAPWAGSQWRQRMGGLWDIGPHALSVMLPTLGPVVDVAATAGPNRLVECLLRHEGGATSTLSVTIHAPAAVKIIDFSLWGESGTATMPPQVTGPLAALSRAAAALVASAGGVTPAHPCDAHFGAEVVGVLERIQAGVARSAERW